MKLNEKLELFSKLSIADAEKRREEVRGALEARLAYARERMRKEAEERRQRAVDEERRRIEFTRNREDLAAFTDVKRSLIELREQLTGDLFVIVRDKVEMFRATDDYFERLIRGIRKYAGEFPSGLTVSVLPDDFERVKAALTDLPEVGFEIAAYEILGGFTARVKGASILIDNSYKTKIEEAKENFQGFRIHGNL